MAINREDEEKRRAQQQAAAAKQAAANEAAKQQQQTEYKAQQKSGEIPSGVPIQNPNVEVATPAPAAREVSDLATSNLPTSKPFDDGDFGNTGLQTPQSKASEGQPQQAATSKAGTQEQRGQQNKEQNQIRQILGSEEAYEDRAQKPREDSSRKGLLGTLSAHGKAALAGGISVASGIAKMVPGIVLGAADYATRGSIDTPRRDWQAERERIAKLINPTSFVKPENMSPEDSKRWDKYYNDVSDRGDRAEVSKSILAALMRQYDPNSINEFLKHGSVDDFLRENGMRNSVSRENGGYMYWTTPTEDKMQDFYTNLPDAALREAESLLTEMREDTPFRGRGYRVATSFSPIGGTTKLEEHVAKLRQAYLAGKNLDRNDPVTKARLEGRIPTAKEYAATNKVLWDKYQAEQDKEQNQIRQIRQQADEAKRERIGASREMPSGVPIQNPNVEVATPNVEVAIPFDNGDFGNAGQQATSNGSTAAKGEAAPAQGTAPAKAETQQEQRGQQSAPAQGASQQRQTEAGQQQAQPQQQEAGEGATAPAQGATPQPQTAGEQQQQTATPQQQEAQPQGQQQTAQPQGEAETAGKAAGQAADESADESANAAGQATDAAVNAAEQTSERDVDYVTADSPTLSTPKAFDDGDFGRDEDLEKARELASGDAYINRLNEVNERRQGRLTRAQRQAERRVAEYARMTPSQARNRATRLARKADHYARRGKKFEAQLYADEADLALRVSKGENPADAIQAQAEESEEKLAEKQREEERAESNMSLNLSRSERDTYFRKKEARDRATRLGNEEKARKLDEDMLAIRKMALQRQINNDEAERKADAVEAAQEAEEKAKKQAADDLQKQRTDYRERYALFTNDINRRTKDVEKGLANISLIRRRREIKQKIDSLPQGEKPSLADSDALKELEKDLNDAGVLVSDLDKVGKDGKLGDEAAVAFQQARINKSKADISQLEEAVDFYRDWIIKDSQKANPRKANSRRTKSKK